MSLTKEAIAQQIEFQKNQTQEDINTFSRNYRAQREEKILDAAEELSLLTEIGVYGKMELSKDNIETIKRIKQRILASYEDDN